MIRNKKEQTFKDKEIIVNNKFGALEEKAKDPFVNKDNMAGQNKKSGDRQQLNQEDKDNLKNNKERESKASTSQAASDMAFIEEECKKSHKVQ